MEELLEQVDNTTKWHGFDVSIEHALEYGLLWTTGHKDTDELYVFMRYGENQWNGCWFSEDPRELINYYDFIDWDEYGDEISSNKWYLTLEQVLLRLQSCNPLDVMGEAYAGYLTTEQVLQQILEAK